jgi:CRP-like cAMP-binding protein
MSPVNPAMAGANRLLATLSSAEIERIAPFLTERRLGHAEPVQPAWTPITELFFPTGCILSVLSESAQGQSVEVATVGNEGMIGAAAFLGASMSPLNTVCQVEGTALTGRTADLVPEDGHSGLRTVALRYSDTMFIQASITALCNRLHPLEQRAARWLLTISDRIEGRTFNLTHEFFAVLLGAQRPSVSLAAQMLQQGGLITYRRGRVEILDQDALAAAACDCYRTITEHYEQTMGITLGRTRDLGEDFVSS